MASAKSIQERNLELARLINEEARSNPNSPYAGKLVGIANGQVVIVTDDWDELADRLLAVEPDPDKRFCLEAGIDDLDPEAQEIWCFG